MQKSKAKSHILPVESFFIKRKTNLTYIENDVIQIVSNNYNCKSKKEKFVDLYFTSEEEVKPTDLPCYVIFDGLVQLIDDVSILKEVNSECSGKIIKATNKFLKNVKYIELTELVDFISVHNNNVTSFKGNPLPYVRCAFVDKVEDIMDSNYKKFQGTNEAELQSREEIADLVEEIIDKLTKK